MFLRGGGGASPLWWLSDGQVESRRADPPLFGDITHQSGPISPDMIYVNHTALCSVLIRDFDHLLTGGVGLLPYVISNISASSLSFFYSMIRGV